MNSKNKIFVSIMGGIGDQIFQYSFATYLRKRLNCEGYLDTCYYKNKKNFNNFIFHLNDLALKNNFIVDNKVSYFDYDKISYFRFIENYKINKFLPMIYKFIFRWPIKRFVYNYWKNKKLKYVLEKDSYYFGYWQNFKYVKNIKKDLNKNLLNIELKKHKLKKFSKKINKRTIAIHIRGGDFKILSSHNILETSYYKNAVKFYKKLLKNPKFHIYTNDIKLSKKIILNILKKHEITFIKNYKFSDIEEFSLYSKYKYAIIANSTFSLMSSYLSLTRKLSIAPKIWLRGERLDKKKQFENLKFI
jgi:hypothetical protein